jgi:ABC-type Fe3+/spermidine/putrescine transport system ATPase subunit
VVDETAEHVLEVRGLTRRFGGLSAIDGFDFEVNQGEILSLIGPNGAGKTTVFNVISGVYPPTSGTILLRGKSIGGLKPDRIQRQGIARTFQTLRLFANMSVLENVLVGYHSRLSSTLFGDIIKPPWVQRQEKRAVDEAREILGRLRASERLRGHVAALTRSHLRLGFLVHSAPLSRRQIYDYLTACAPVAVDVTVLSVADRLATRGANAEAAIDAHRRLAAEILPPALAFEADPPRPPVRGDELAAALEIAPGPQLGHLLAELQAAAYAGEIRGREEAIVLARRMLERERR